MIARLLCAAPGLALLAAMVVLVLLVASEERRTRRVEARRAEHRARPHSAHVGTAAEDAAAILTTRLHEEQNR